LKSNPLVVFALDLMSAYEGEHMIFGLLGQANFTKNDVLQFHPFTCESHPLSCGYIICQTKLMHSHLAHK
jgi:hypothetical protein